MLEIREFLDDDGHSPFGHWFNRLSSTVSARIATALYRMEQGNLSNAKGVGSGVMEYRIHAGAGYRIYFGQDGERLIILLAGGSKRQQQKDIDAAKDRWKRYKQRKKEQRT